MESGGRISLHLANLPNIGWLVDILADAYRLLLEQAGLAAKLATELSSAHGSIPNLPGTVQAIDDLPQEQQQICAGRQDLGVERWAVMSARRAQLGSDPGPSRLFPAPALTLSLR